MQTLICINQMSPWDEPTLWAEGVPLMGAFGRFLTEKQ
jgi:hypothetical protein